MTTMPPPPIEPPYNGPHQSPPYGPQYGAPYAPPPPAKKRSASEVAAYATLGLRTAHAGQRFDAGDALQQQ